MGYASGRWAVAYTLAKQAGLTAGEAAAPVPMVVGEAKGLLDDEIDETRPTYYVPEGPCGFAWVNVSPGTHPFARWLKKNDLARRSYHGGVDIWIGEHGQSLARKAAHAGAMAEALQRDLGERLTATPISRMDRRARAEPGPQGRARGERLTITPMSRMD